MPDFPTAGVTATAETAPETPAFPPRSSSLQQPAHNLLHLPHGRGTPRPSLPPAPCVPALASCPRLAPASASLPLPPLPALLSLRPPPAPCPLPLAPCFLPRPLLPAPASLPPAPCFLLPAPASYPCRRTNRRIRSSASSIFSCHGRVGGSGRIPAAGADARSPAHGHVFLLEQFFGKGVVVHSGDPMDGKA